MTPSYSSYATFTVDTTHIYGTVVVDGSATCNEEIEHINCNAIRHQGQPSLVIGKTGGKVYGPQVCPTCYVSVSNPQSVPYTAGDTFNVTVEGAVFCSGIGSLIYEAFINAPQLGAGYTLVENKSSPSGFGCETSNGVTMCSFLVAPSCTNTPQWAPQVVDDGPPASSGWYSDYYCTRFSSSQPWSCQAIPDAAIKTADKGPVKCPFYVIVPF